MPALRSLPVFQLDNLMRILIDIGHPAHVHYFRNLNKELGKKGYEFLYTARDKEATIQLLKHYKLNYISLGKPYKTIAGKIWGLAWFTFLIFCISLKFKPDMFINATMYSAFVAWILNKPHLSFEDTFNMEQVCLYRPFTTYIFTGKYPHPDLGKKEIRYDGYQELMYLHPKRFTPDRSVLKELNVKEGEKYFILRFVSWDASHDIGQSGLTLEQKRQLVDLLRQHGKVFISSEKKIEAEFEPYEFRLPLEKMHDALAFADLFVGEGATMASECAALGTPAVYVNSMEAGTIDEQEKYGLVYHFRNGNGVIEKTRELISDSGLKEKCKKARGKLLSEKIDVTAFLVWFIENWPSSPKIIKESSLEFWEQFK